MAAVIIMHSLCKYLCIGWSVCGGEGCESVWYEVNRDVCKYRSSASKIIHVVFVFVSIVSSVVYNSDKL